MDRARGAPKPRAGEAERGIVCAGRARLQPGVRLPESCFREVPVPRGGGRSAGQGATPSPGGSGSAPGYSPVEPERGWQRRTEARSPSARRTRRPAQPPRERRLPARPVRFPAAAAGGESARSPTVVIAPARPGAADARHHERRRGGLLGLAPQVPAGEKVEALCMEEAMVCATQWSADRRSRCLGILQE